MRVVLLALAAHVAADCADCCAAGGSCAHAYKQTPGVCCGGNQCCPLGYRCAATCGGLYRCLGPGERGRPTADCHDPDGALVSLVFLVFLVAGVVCVGCWLLPRFAHTTQTSQPLAPTVAVPSYVGGGNTAMGFVGGMLVADMLDDACPPTYNEVTTDGVQVDV